jgi:hypothetical protein
MEHRNDDKESPNSQVMCQHGENDALDHTCLIVRNILSIIDYPLLLILIKQASPADSVMGKINQ